MSDEAERWIDRPNCDVRAAVLRRPFAFESPFGGRSFALLLVSSDPSVTDDERFELATQIVRSGCAYVVCWGEACSAWEDDIDLADVMREVDSEREREYLMTTSHPDESLEEAVFFVSHCAALPDLSFERFLIAFVGDDAALRDRCAVLVRQHFAERS